MNIKTNVLCIALIILCGNVFSDTLAEWDIANAEFSAPVLNTASGLTATSISPIGIRPMAWPIRYPGAFAADGWSVGAYDVDKYYSFSVTADLETTVTLDGIALALTFGNYMGTGSSNWVLRTSADNFSSDLLNYTLTTFNDQVTFSDSFDTALTVADGDSLEFRLYGYYPGTSEDFSGLVNMVPGDYHGDVMTGTGSNVVLYGTIPEPMTLSLIGSAMVIGFFVRRRFTD